MVARVCDRAKRLSKRACNVRACSCFWGLRSVIAISHILVAKTTFYTFTRSYFSLIPNMHQKMHLISAKFALKLPFCYKRAGASAKCDHQRIGVCAGVHATLDLDVRAACMRRKKRSQFTPWNLIIFS